MAELILRPYQFDATERLRRAFAAGARSPLLVLPTGGGKTICFTWMTMRAAERGRRVLLLAHRRELVSQISRALREWSVDHGIISPSAPATKHDVQVAMAQTLSRRIRMDKTGRFKFDLVIIDEAHHATRCSTWGAVLKHNADAKFLGVSATPVRLDGQGLGVESGGFFDELICGPSVSELIGMGYLAKPVVYVPDRSVDLDGVKKRGGDYVQSQLASRMDQNVLTGDAVEHYRQYCDGLPAIAFTVTVAHSEHVVQEFRAAGYQAAVLSGSTPDKERDAMIRDLGRGQLHVLASCNVVSEGTDIPTVAAAILLRPTESYSLALQQMGRALRALPGKDRAIILDHAGNCLKHGLPTDDVNWSLAGMQKKSTGKSTRCFKCQTLSPASSTQCVNCGMPFKSEPKPARTNSEQEALPLKSTGRLVELTPEMRRALARERFEEERQARSVEDLVRIGTSRGYQYPEGWARHRYSELRGSSQ
jgi:DNA repair protein RadD